jgi:hypothetical protein
MKPIVNYVIEASERGEPATVTLTRAELRQAHRTAIEFEINRLQRQVLTLEAEGERSKARQKIDYLHGLLRNMKANENWKGPRLMSRAEMPVSEESD